MTDPVPDLPPIDVPMADLGHEGIRVAFVSTTAQTAKQIGALRGDLTNAQSQLAGTQQRAADAHTAVAGLAGRVAALESTVARLTGA